MFCTEEESTVGEAEALGVPMFRTVALHVPARHAIAALRIWKTRHQAGRTLLAPAEPFPSEDRGAGHASRRRGTGFAGPPASSPWG